MNDFYEDDEPVEDLLAAFGDGPHRVTVTPDASDEQIAEIDRQFGNSSISPLAEWWISDPQCQVSAIVHGVPAIEPPIFMGLPMVRA